MEPDNRLTALIDGDTIAFRIASAVQGTIEWPSGWIEPFARRWEGEAALDSYMSKLVRRLGVSDFKVFISCPSEDNWRLKVDPEYKSNRKASIRPLLLEPLKEYLRLKYGATHLAYLEADDVLGLYATDKSLCPERCIVVGRDKDFHTIPGLHYQLKDDDPFSLGPIIRKVSFEEAQMNHYVQALAGDAVDGYPGCPGIGMKRARTLLEQPERLVRTTGTITRGPNKGQTTERWVSGGACTPWEAIVSCYEKEGLGVAEAIQNARLARILQAGDYNMETKEVRLWEPPLLTQPPVEKENA